MRPPRASTGRDWACQRLAVFPGGSNSPLAGYRVPLTLLAIPKESAPTSFEVHLADPSRIGTIRVGVRTFAVAMDLEAALDASHATGPRFLDALGYLLRSDRKRSRLTFLQPYDPERIPIVLIRGLISTPRMWAPVVKGLMAVPEIRERYQFWFFYYPTGQPIPLSALQLREALDEALLTHRVKPSLILIGHSMGEILARAQVSRITPEAADEILPNVSKLPVERTVRRSLIFEPRTGVQRLIFICTPHRGSRLATSGIAGLGILLIHLPGWIAEELADFAEAPFLRVGGRLPTSIHGLSPSSRFLQALNRTPPSSPSHSIIGQADDVAPLGSAHLGSALSEILVPAGHGGFAHSSAIEEIKRILMPASDNGKSFRASGPVRPDAIEKGFSLTKSVLRLLKLSGVSNTRTGP